MATEKADNILVLAPKPLDDKFGIVDVVTGQWRPFNDLTEFNSVFVTGAKFENMTFWVRSTIDPDQSDLYVLDKNKVPVKILENLKQELVDYVNPKFSDNLSDI